MSASGESVPQYDQTGGNLTNMEMIRQQIKGRPASIGTDETVTLHTFTSTNISDYRLAGALFSTRSGAALMARLVAINAGQSLQE
jgi:hypothetical protein